MKNMLKMPVLKFQKVPELEISSMKEQVFHNYFSLAKILKHYQASKFEQWIEHCTPIMEQAMQMDVLKFVNIVSSGKSKNF